MSSSAEKKEPSPTRRSPRQSASSATGDVRAAADVERESSAQDLSPPITSFDNDSDHKSWNRSSLKTGITFTYDLMSSFRCLWDPNHEANPERFIAVHQRMEEYGLIDRCERIAGAPATREQLLTVHTADLIDDVAATDGLTDEAELERRSAKYDAVYFHPNTYQAALWSAGSAVALVDAVLTDKVRNGFALIRPPGHHAMTADACGYCFFNNVAIAAKHALSSGSAARVLIVDWDVHHGQATQQTFLHDDRVLYISIHRYEDGTFWPHLIESDYHVTGVGQGLGYNVNLPLNCIGMNDRDYLSLFHNVILPLSQRFDPDLVLISSGYDAAIGCPEGEMRVSPATYAHLTHGLMALAEGRVVALLEGGYCIQSLAESAALTLRCLLGDPAPDIIHLSGQRIHQPLLESALNAIYAIRPHHPDLFPLQATFDRKSAADATAVSEDEEEFFRIRHYPLVNYRGTVSLQPKPESYPTRGTCPVQEPGEKERLLQEIVILRQETHLNNKFIGKKRTGISFSDTSKGHKCSVAHPERPSRTAAIMKRLTIDGLTDLCRLLHEERLATDAELLLVHTEDYVRQVKKIKSLSESVISDIAAGQDSIYLTPKTEMAARASAGSLLSLIDAVMSQDVLNGFACIRPPGHHARGDSMAGFCIFNNIAIGAKYLNQVHGQERILILDVDVHHGDGTQSIVKGKNNGIQFISLHRYDCGDFYPGSLDAGITAAVDENIVNIPFSHAKMTESEYLSSLFSVLLPIAYDYRPQVILISAGFDAASKDPLGEYAVDPVFFGHLVHHLMPICGGKVIAVLEGGYHLSAIARSAANVVAALNGMPLPRLPLLLVDDGAQQVLRDVNDFQKTRWPSLVFGVDLPVNKNVEKGDRSQGTATDATHDTSGLEKQFAQLFSTPVKSDCDKDNDRL